MQNIRTRLVVKFICQVMDIPYVGRFLAIPFAVFLFAWDFCNTKATTCTSNNLATWFGNGKRRKKR